MFFLMGRSYRNRAISSSIIFVDLELEIFSKIRIIPTGNFYNFFLFTAEAVKDSLKFQYINIFFTSTNFNQIYN